MATQVSFDNMLKQYLPYSLLKEEMEKRDYLLTKITKDQKWKGGEMQVPFRGGKASSIAYGELTDVAQITEDRHVRGTVPGYKELWGSMIFNDHDLAKHGDMAQSFIKILPDMIEDFLGCMKEAVSVNLLNGSHIVSYDSASLANDLVNGVIAVDRPARVTIGQFLEFGIPGVPRTNGYVKEINMSDKTLLINDDISLTGTDTDLAGAGVVAGDKAFVRGAIAIGSGFTSLRDQLLSAAAGGSASLFGVTKTAYPHLQAFNADGSGITGANILESIFDAYNETRQLGKGAPTDVILSYKHLGNVMKALEVSREYTGSDTKASVYGWTEISVVGVKGQLKIVGVMEMDDDIIHILDWNSMKLHSNGMFERRTSPEGRSFFEVRNTDGYKYVVDTRFFGELVVSKPSYNGIIHSISY
jgi:hypothetical protein